MEIAKLKKVLVVEGQMDVVMSHQAGNCNTVAISGTAFTLEHISIIRRFAETIILALDTDKAGYTAMLKSAALALENDLEVEGIKLIDKDPADMIIHDLVSWEKSVNNPKPILTLIAEIILEKEKIKPRQIQLLRKDLFPLLRVIKSPLLKESYIKEIAKLLDMDISVIRQETENLKNAIEPAFVKSTVKPVKMPQIEILTLLAETVASINLLDDPDLENFYKNKLQEYLNLQSEISQENLPEEIITRESIILETKFDSGKTDEESLKNKKERINEHTKEIMFIFIKKILEKAMEDLKIKMKVTSEPGKEKISDEELKENLQKIQDFTKKINTLKQNLVYT